MWHILIDTNKDILKRYVDSEVCSPWNRENLLKTQDAKMDKRKGELKFKKEKKTVIESGIEIEIDGEMEIKNGKSL